MTKKGTKWKWEKIEQQAFEKAKKELLAERLLWTFDPDKPLIIKTNVSDHITAGIASQERQSLEFISKKMNSVEQNYTISKKKMMTIVQAVSEWRKYLKENIKKNKIIMNHKNLTYFKKVQIINQ